LHRKAHRNAEALVQFAAAPESRRGNGAAVIACLARDHLAALRLAGEAVAVPHELDEIVIGLRACGSKVDARVLDGRNRREPLGQLHHGRYGAMNGGRIHRQRSELLDGSLDELFVAEAERGAVKAGNELDIILTALVNTNMASPLSKTSGRPLFSFFRSLKPSSIASLRQLPRAIWRFMSTPWLSGVRSRRAGEIAADAACLQRWAASWIRVPDSPNTQHAFRSPTPWGFSTRNMNHVRQSGVGLRWPELRQGPGRRPSTLFAACGSRP
jgi:hypothetical protein